MKSILVFLPPISIFEILQAPPACAALASAVMWEGQASIFLRFWTSSCSEFPSPARRAAQEGASRCEARLERRRKSQMGGNLLDPQHGFLLEKPMRRKMRRPSPERHSKKGGTPHPTNSRQSKQGCGGSRGTGGFPIICLQAQPKFSGESYPFPRIHKPLFINAGAGAPPNEELQKMPVACKLFFVIAR